MKTKIFLFVIFILILAAVLIFNNQTLLDDYQESVNGELLQSYSCDGFDLEFTGHDFQTKGPGDDYVAVSANRNGERIWVDQGMNFPFISANLPMKVHTYYKAVESKQTDSFLPSSEHAPSYLNLEVQSPDFTESDFDKIVDCFTKNKESIESIALFENDSPLKDSRYQREFATIAYIQEENTKNHMQSSFYTFNCNNPDNVVTFKSNKAWVNGEYPVGYVNEDLLFNFTDTVLIGREIDRVSQEGWVSNVSQQGEQRSRDRLDWLVNNKELAKELVGSCKNSDGKTILDYFPVVNQ